ncbi:MAG: site-specific integrase [Lactobacillaceae bacterium]|jgi:hypothetical protein|nr:site-specific integrase [Lactobacillaceae bacterium]
MIYNIRMKNKNPPFNCLINQVWGKRIFDLVFYVSVNLLTAGSIDFTNQCFRFEETKTGKQIRPFGKGALKLLNELKTERKDNKWVFPAERGNGHFNCRCTAEPYEPPAKVEVSNYDKAVYGLAAASQGYSLGFSDEIEGLLNGAGHVIAKGSDKIYTKIQPHLAEKYPDLPKNIYNPERGFVDAFKEGYKSQRDERRAHLKEGKEKAPIISTAAETLGAVFSPVKLSKTAKTAPLEIKSRKNLIEATVTGGIYGVGVSEEDSDYAINIGMGVAGGIIGKNIGNRLYGRGAERATSRVFINSAVDLSTNNLIEATFKKREK